MYMAGSSVLQALLTFSSTHLLKAMKLLTQTEPQATAFLTSSPHGSIPPAIYAHAYLCLCPLQPDPKLAALLRSLPADASCSMACAYHTVLFAVLHGKPEAGVGTGSAASTGAMRCC